MRIVASVFWGLARIATWPMYPCIIAMTLFEWAAGTCERAYAESRRQQLHSGT